MDACVLRHQRSEFCGERRSWRSLVDSKPAQPPTTRPRSAVQGCPGRMMDAIMALAPCHHSHARSLSRRPAAQPVHGARSRASANRNASHVDAPSPRCSYRTPGTQQRKWGWPTPQAHKAGVATSSSVASQALPCPYNSCIAPWAQSLVAIAPARTESLLRVISKTETTSHTFSCHTLPISTFQPYQLLPLAAHPPARSLIYLATYHTQPTIPVPLSYISRNTHTHNQPTLPS